ncbi:MAG: ferritin-like domain-containing protein [Pseudomonadales bacterium]|jgi:1,2-phenylacetyl-CoA epoxidase catalytic subunit|nr:ferritin-like domain-containing protein [Gammaproteobacteria bacterium]
MRMTAEPHELPEADFLSEVHSFDFWFQAVEGYLLDTEHGRDAALTDAPMEEVQRENLISTLCNYCVGETAALEASSGMIGYAPDRCIKIFLATQVVDEGRHLEVFLHRLSELGVADPDSEILRRANPALLKFKEQLLEYVDSRDWEAAVFAQNIILESLEFTVFGAHAQTADPITQQVLLGVVKDERRHMGFGENDLGRRLALTPHLRPRLKKIKRRMDMLVMETFAGTLRDTGASAEDQARFTSNYLATVARLGVDL